MARQVRRIASWPRSNKGAVDFETYLDWYDYEGTEWRRRREALSRRWMHLGAVFFSRYDS